MTDVASPSSSVAKAPLAMVVENGQLVPRARPLRRPGPGEVLVSVAAAGVNNADIAQVAGSYPAPPDAPPDVPGLELAGTVIEAGQGVVRFSPGDRIMALVGGGAYAEEAVFNERLAISVPDGIDDAAAAGFPEAFVTAHDALFTQCQLSLGERVLIHGAAGGVGTAAVQLAVACGAEVVAAVRSPDRRSDVESLGAATVGADDFADRGPYDVILELASAQNIPANVRCLKPDGRLSLIGLGRDKTAEVNFSDLARLRGRILASTLRSRSLERRSEAVRRVESHVVPLLAAGRVRVPVFARFPLTAAAEAHERFVRGGKFGKIILESGGMS